MADAIRAEWRKLRYNRWLMGFTVYIFPLSVFIIGALALLVATLGSGPARASVVAPDWQQEVLKAWVISGSFFA